jgi:hypothetical protein
VNPDSDYRDKIRKLLNEKPQRNVYKRFTILAYQLADVGRCLRYMEIYPDEREAQFAYFKTAMADLLTQSVILTELYKLDLGALLKLGLDRLEEFKKKARYVEVE